MKTFENLLNENLLNRPIQQVFRFSIQQVFNRFIMFEAKNLQIWLQNLKTFGFKHDESENLLNPWEHDPLPGEHAAKKSKPVQLKTFWLQNS